MLPEVALFEHLSRDFCARSKIRSLGDHGCITRAVRSCRSRRFQVPILKKNVLNFIGYQRGKFIFRFLNAGFLKDYSMSEGSIVQARLLLCGGIDFQHREGSKVGSGGQLSESQAALERKERLRKLALETIDISKDPYFMRNHLGTYECKLCLTLHPNEGNYLAHTQGKRHQYNLGRRAAMEAKNAAPRLMVTKEVPKKVVMKIGRPGYKVS